VGGAAPLVELKPIELRDAGEIERAVSALARALDHLWARYRHPVSARGRLRRSHPQGREPGRPASASADQVRAGHQSQDCQGARSQRAGFMSTRPN